MPTSKATAAERREQTLKARQQSRYNAAQNRIRRIVAAAPSFTDEQVAQLVELLQGADSAPE